MRRSILYEHVNVNMPLFGVSENVTIIFITIDVKRIIYYTR